MSCLNQSGDLSQRLRSVSVTTLEGLVSDAESANVLFASAVLNVSASFRVLMEYSSVSWRINSNPLLVCTPGFMSTPLLAREIPSEKALINVAVRAWLVKVLLIIANKRIVFLLAAAWVDPGRNALQSAEQRC